MNWIKSLSFVLLVSLVYQNCSPTKFSDEEKVTPQGGCSNPNTLCLNNHKVRAVNGVLASLGQFEVEVSAGTNTNGVDAQGYIHVNIYNPLSGRKGYLKIKYVGSFTYKTEEGEMKISTEFNFKDYPIYFLEYARQFCEDLGVTLMSLTITFKN